ISPERWLAKQGADLQNAARVYDQAFRAQLNSGQLVLVGSKPGNAQSGNDYLLPSPDYLLALPDFDMTRFIGIADFPYSEDGVVRQFLITPHASKAQPDRVDGIPEIGFPALLALHASGADPHAGSWTLASRRIERAQPAMLIPFFGPPDTIAKISLREVLGEAGLSAANRALLQDKVVLIGAGAGLGDDHQTPYATSLFGSRGRLMSGVEIHANVVEALLSGDRLLALSEPMRWGLLALVGIGSALVFGFVSPWLASLLWLVGCLLTIWFGFLAFESGILLPVAAAGSGSLWVLLSVSAWRLSGEEQERQRMRQMFGRYVSKQVVEALLQSGLRPQLGGVSQTMTVLFADIRNFTTISELLSAKEVVEMLNTYFERACTVMMQEGGSIDKFIGDAIMVEFGSPLPMADHAVRAARAALGLHRVAEQFGVWMAQRFPDRNLPAFAVGIGLHSGEVVIGNIGSAARMEFTAIGDTVNLASRIEGKTKELGCAILATEATRAAAGGLLLTGRSEQVQVKGRAAAVWVYEILGIQTGG
ncbi:MAG: adenylate/guanylate cyclase domain-containing protein, partial [Rhodoferax sp.]|nr:adenylate/guanylate cyclase domain-containing protein [Rhodoferax sp.]